MTKPKGAPRARYTLEFKQQGGAPGQGRSEHRRGGPHVAGWTWSVRPCSAGSRRIGKASLWARTASRRAPRKWWEAAPGSRIWM